MHKGTGQLDVIKYMTFKDKVSTQEATKLIAGSAYVPFSCQVRGLSRRLSSLCWTGYLDIMSIGARDMGNPVQEWVELCVHLGP